MHHWSPPCKISQFEFWNPEKGEVSKVLKIVLKYEQMMDADEWFWLKADSLLLHFSTYIFLSFFKVLNLLGNLNFRAKI